jgi:hypothetical protein
MVLFLFNTVIYVLLLLCRIVRLCTYCIFMYLLYVYVFIVCLCIPSDTLTEVFPCSFLSCKANVRVTPAKMGHGPHSSQMFVLFYVLFVLCRSVYCLCVNVY